MTLYYAMYMRFSLKQHLIDDQNIIREIYYQLEMVDKGESGPAELISINQTQLDMANAAQGLQLNSEAKTLMQQNSHLRFMMTSVVASSVANVAGLLAGHPLDTIKVS